jgi:hypothetical protein
MKEKTHVNQQETMARANNAIRPRKALRIQSHVKAGPIVIIKKVQL